MIVTGQDGTRWFILKDMGYGLLCVAKAIGPLEVETQDEDEVYEKQFGKYLGEVKSHAGSPFDL